MQPSATPPRDTWPTPPRGAIKKNKTIKTPPIDTWAIKNNTKGHFLFKFRATKSPSFKWVTKICHQKNNF